MNLGGFGGDLMNIFRRNGVKVNLNNNIGMNPTSTRYLVADYLNYRLRKEQYHWDNCPPLEGIPNKIHLTMRGLGDNFEERYRNEFDDMVNQLHITPNVAYPTFVTVANELFSDGQNWGRIVALVAFGGAIAVQCVENNLVHLVDSIFDWVSTYIQTNLKHWIDSQGGWDAFVDFYESEPDSNGKSNWPSFGSLCLGAAGVLALGAIFSQKT